MFQLDQLSSEIERAALRWYMAELRYGKICKLPKLGKELFMLCAKRHINRRTSLVSSKEPAPSKHIPNAEFCPHCNPCRNGELMARWERLAIEYDTVLRGLASYVAAGGFNFVGFIDPQIAGEKIRWGIDHFQ